MKRESVGRLLAGGALLTLAVAFSSAQTIRANIPFAFVASGSNLSAGEYTVEGQGWTDQMLQLCNLQQHQCAFVVASQVESRRNNEPGKLVFNRYGNRYFLSEIWSASIIQTLPKSRSERLLAKSGSEPVLAVIAAELSSHTGR